MKKAVITTGSKQYIVSEGDELDIELLDPTKKSVDLEALLVIDDDKVKVGKPTVEGAKVTIEITDQVKADKVTAIRYKAKKRVHKVRGHRQQHSRVLVKKIS